MNIIRRVRLLAVLLAAFTPFALHAQTTTGYKSNGTDLGSIFAPYHAGWPKAAATGYYVNGTDLDDIFAPLSTGTAAGPTGYKLSNGADLNTIFAAYGSTGVQAGVQPSAVSGSAAAGNPSGTVTSNTTTVAGTKGGGSYSYTWHLSGSASLTGPTSATTGVTNSAVPAGTTLSGSMYCTISDGVTSANTNTVGWSLQNTTPATITVDANLVAGQYQIGVSPNITTYTGYASGHSTGSFTITSGTIPNGGSVTELWSWTNNTTQLLIQGLSSEIGQGGLISVTINGVTLTGSGASSHTYSSGQEEWSWGGQLGLVVGDQYPVVLTFTG